MLGYDRITADPMILGGKACIRELRISVSLVVNLVANGMSTKEIIDRFDQELLDGALISVTDDAIRVRRLPVA